MTELVHDPETHKLGKGPPKVIEKTVKLADHVDHEAIKVPPYFTLRPHPKAGWGMFGNDEYGDCTCATVGHRIQGWTAATGKEARVTTEEVLAAYSAVTGFRKDDPSTDNGAVEDDVLKYWRRHGIAGHKIAGYAYIDPHNIDLMKFASQAFGGVYLGAELPEAAQSATVWGMYEGPGDKTPGSWGGHAFDIRAHRPDYAVIVTWGEDKRMTWDWWREYGDEAWAVVSKDWLDASGKTPNGLDLDGLMSALEKVGH